MTNIESIQSPRLQHDAGPVAEAEVVEVTEESTAEPTTGGLNVGSSTGAVEGGEGEEPASEGESAGNPPALPQYDITGTAAPTPVRSLSFDHVLNMNAQMLNRVNQVAGNEDSEEIPLTTQPQADFGFGFFDPFAGIRPEGRAPAGSGAPIPPVAMQAFGNQFGLLPGGQPFTSTIYTGSSPGTTTTPPMTGTPDVRNIDLEDLNTIDTNYNFRDRNDVERTIDGLDNEARAAEHLWGRQMISEGFQNGGITITVLQDLKASMIQNGMDPAEAQQRVLDTVADRILVHDSTADVAALINGANLPTLLNTGFEVLDESVVLRQPEVDLSADVIAQDLLQFGHINGRHLDIAFAENFERTLGANFPVDLNDPRVLSRYQAATGPTRIPGGDPNDFGTMSAANGLSTEEMLLMRYWSHSRLMPTAGQRGQVNPSILPYTILAGDNALDAGADMDVTRKFIELDILNNGSFDGDILVDGFDSVLNKLYLGGEDFDIAEYEANAVANAQNRGLTMPQITQSVTQGIQDAMNVATQFVQDHPVLTGMTVGGAAIAAGACPYMSATAVAGGSMALSNHALAGTRRA